MLGVEGKKGTCPYFSGIKERIGDFLGIQKPEYKSHWKLLAVISSSMYLDHTYTCARYTTALNSNRELLDQDDLHVSAHTTRGISSGVVWSEFHFLVCSPRQD